MSNNKPKEFRFGKKGEDIVLELLTKLDIPANRPEPFSKYYDLILKLDKEYTAEIKADLMGARTGNIALEFWNSRKNEASGISATKSDLWFHIFCKEVWVANTLDLKVYVQNNSPHKMTFDSGDKNANLYLYNAKVIFGDIFTRLDNLDIKTAKELLIKKLPL
jgi:hypothetical protein